MNTEEQVKKMILNILDTAQCDLNPGAYIKLLADVCINLEERGSDAVNKINDGETRSKIDMYTAVFNSHMNNALDRACEKYIEEHGLQRYNEKILPYIDRGIMSIFDENPNEDTIFLTVAIHGFVNGPK